MGTEWRINSREQLAFLDESPRPMIELSSDISNFAPAIDNCQTADRIFLAQNNDNRSSFSRILSPSHITPWRRIQILGSLVLAGGLFVSAGLGALFSAFKSLVNSPSAPSISSGVNESVTALQSIEPPEFLRPITDAWVSLREGLETTDSAMLTFLGLLYAAWALLLISGRSGGSQSSGEED
jgi:hypothetical protein